jgi:hypothetical protein
MTWYVGLTDDPDRRRKEHGSPPDWQQTATAFNTEAEARAWEAKYVGKPGYQGGSGGGGWRYGYWYAISPQAKQ